MPGREEDLFRQAMDGVRRLKHEPKVWPVEVRKKEHAPKARPVRLPSSGRGPSRTETPWVLKADGISHEQLRRLSSGHFPQDFELDLHGMTRDEATEALSNCVSRMISSGRRVLSVIHGRGLHSSQGYPVLKKATYDWLSHGSYAGWVLAVVPKPGSGGGSCLVLLRRSRE
jgi:DNA-nicking Smr family endonuclease